MPLDPQAQTLLDQLALFEGPKIQDLPIDEARAVFTAFKTMLPKVEAARTADHLVEGMTLRAHYPMGLDAGAGPVPVVVWFHEGGFTVGNLDTSDSLAADLANSSGCVVVNVDYPLAPEHPFPEPLEAAYRAVEWVAEHARDLGVDPARLAVGGDSAGGNLATTVCMLAKERGGPAIRFQLMAYPCLDARMSYPSIRENGEGRLLEAGTMRWFWDNYVGAADPEDPLVSPLYAPEDALAGLPPALVLTAEYDPLRDEGEAYAERLRQAGVDVVASRYDGVLHSLLSMAELWDAGRKAMDECARALRTALA